MLPDFQMHNYYIPVASPMETHEEKIADFCRHNYDISIVTLLPELSRYQNLITSIFWMRMWYLKHGMVSKGNLFNSFILFY